jgi:hypothetical protein
MTINRTQVHHHTSTTTVAKKTRSKKKARPARKNQSPAKAKMMGKALKASDKAMKAVKMQPRTSQPVLKASIGNTQFTPAANTPNFNGLMNTIGNTISNIGNNITHGIGNILERFNISRATFFNGNGSKLEGGKQGSRGVHLPNFSLEKFLAGKAPYIAVAAHPSQYGQEFLSQVNIGGEIKTLKFKVLDTGGAFMGKQNPNKTKFDIFTELPGFAEGSGPNWSGAETVRIA